MELLNQTVVASGNTSGDIDCRVPNKVVKLSIKIAITFGVAPTAGAVIKL